MLWMLVDQIVDYAIFAMDSDGIVVTWNRGAELIFGYRMEEVLGHPASMLYPTTDSEETFRRTLEIATRTRSSGTLEYRRRSDGRKVRVDAAITAMRDTSGELLGFAEISRRLD